MTDPGQSVESSKASEDVLPYADLSAPKPLASAPPAAARWLAFAGIVLGGLLGGMVGFGTSELLGAQPWLSAIVAVGFAIGGAAGVGVVAQLTLRAMNEWRAVVHPEDDRV